MWGHDPWLGETMLGAITNGDVVVLELQREDRRNALNLELCREIHRAVDQAVSDGARAIVITGQGTAFCAGADLGGVYGMLTRLTKVPVPLIAAINGPAIGAGTQLAMACDLRVAETTAKFAVPTARNGMAVDAWTIRTLATLAGGGTARRLMLAAETLDAKQALAVGLVDRIGTLADAVAWAQEIAELAPLALAHNKLVLNSSAADDAAIEASFASVWASEDVREAATARDEKRPPVFKGR